MIADDCVLYKSGATWRNIHGPLQCKLNSYIEWGNKNYLKLNADKAKAILIVGSSHQVNPVPFNAGNRHIICFTVLLFGSCVG